MPKKVGDYIMDLGRAVAFYPGLKKIIGSTNAVILLCQLIYWSDKSSDNGWIWKSSDEIEEETSLTYNEQFTARKILVDMNIIEEEYKRLDHKIRFRVNQEELNKQWEEATFKKLKPAPVKEEVVEEKPEEKPIEYTYVTETLRYSVTPDTVNSVHPTYLIETLDEQKNVVSTRRSEVAPIKDPVGKWIEMNTSSPGAIKKKHLNEIRKKIENRLHFNTDSSRWEKFIEYVYHREIDKAKPQPIDIFIDWALENGFSPKTAQYWSPVKMKELYPQAFLEKENEKPFVVEPPDKPEKEYEPMPDFAKRNKKLY